tara:strand:- start:3898 stop:5247 length:1350 start_codon:yes stop_codon:yes gene_type:complete
MSNRTDAQAAIDGLIANQGIANSITPTSLGTERLQVILDGAAMTDELLEALPTSRVNVKTAADLSGTLSSTTLYFVDGIIDMGTQDITIPSGGLTFKGYSNRISQLVSTADNYDMFVSAVGGCGSILKEAMSVSVSGANSRVYNCTAIASPTVTFEISHFNWVNCTSLGVLSGFAQGVEISTGRLFGTPSLTLDGAWSAGYRSSTTIVRELSSGMTEPLFKAGATFTMASRYLTDINCDLPALAAYTDFIPANFLNDSTFQLRGAIFTRNGAVDVGDTNILPNINEADLQSSFKDNIGILNTHVGGKLKVASESATSIAAGSTYYTLAANWANTNLVHFDNPTEGQLRHLGSSPIEFRVQADFTVDSSANNELAIRLRVWRDATSSFVEFQPQVRQVNSLQGGRDVAFFTIFTSLRLEKDDYVYFQVANNSGNSNVTLEADSFFAIEER